MPDCHYGLTFLYMRIPLIVLSWHLFIDFRRSVPIQQSTLYIFLILISYLVSFPSVLSLFFGVYSLSLSLSFSLSLPRTCLHTCLSLCLFLALSQSCSGLPFSLSLPLSLSLSLSLSFCLSLSISLFNVLSSLYTQTHINILFSLTLEL